MDAPHRRKRSGVHSAYRQCELGICCQSCEPKSIVFFVSLYAVVVPTSATVSTKLLVLAGGFLLEITGYGLVIVLFSMSPASQNSTVLEPGSNAVGTIFAGFGLRLIVENL
ncbi:LysE family transporter [Pararhizobium qamdonense]|uniref:LysE family transporter n=1 Tax=Pararhizobium qamdonense TaxID=3031126 RepID=UPI0038B328BE